MTEIVNVDQAAGWDGADGDDWTRGEEQYNASMAALYGALVASMDVAPHERVLDIGCGCGESTRDAARRAHAGSAVGVDLSTQMLARARQRAAEEGLTNVEFVRADAQVHDLGQQRFDRVISRFGVMFFADPVAAFTNIRRALVDDALVNLLVWRSLGENEFFLELRAALALGRDLPAPPPGAPSPFGLADPDRVRHVLTTAGFRDVSLTPVDAAMRAGADVDSAFEFVLANPATRGMLSGVDDADRARGHANIRASLEAHATPSGVQYRGACWIVSAQAG